MYNEEMMRGMMELITNPAFRKGFLDFYLKMQQEGFEEAKKAWSKAGEKEALPDAWKFYEKLAELYMLPGFVPRIKYDELQKENERLKNENEFLKEAIKELQVNLYKEGTEKARQAWQEIIDKQMDMNREMAKSFFEQLGSFSKKGSNKKSA